jgi:hypothetical protein
MELQFVLCEVGTEYIFEDVLHVSKGESTYIYYRGMAFVRIYVDVLQLVRKSLGEDWHVVMMKMSADLIKYERLTLILKLPEYIVILIDKGT